MKDNTIRIISWLFASFLLGLIVWWLVSDTSRTFQANEPGQDGRPDSLLRAADDVKIGEFFMRYQASPQALSSSWPRFRGSDFSNIIEDDVQFDPNKEPEIIWQITTGEGHAAPAIHNGKVYLLDYNEELSSDALRCIDLKSGKEIWRRWYRVAIKRNHGMSRTVPAIEGNHLVTIGPKGQVMCVHPETGDIQWTYDIFKEEGGEVPFWYTGQCPLIDNGVAVIATGGSNLMVGIDCETGQVVWQTPNPKAYTMSHSSIYPIELAGKRTYVYLSIGGVVGVSAETKDLGKLLWQNSEWNPSVIAPSPVQLNDQTIFVTAGYGAGGASIQIDALADGSFKATLIEKHKPRDGICSEQQTPILYKDKIYTVLPKDGGAFRERLVAYHPSDLTTPIWNSAKEERFGLGPYIIINQHMVVLEDQGTLFYYKLEDESIQQINQFKIFDAVDAWGGIAIADNLMIIRDAHHVICLKVSDDES